MEEQPPLDVTWCGGVALLASGALSSAGAALLAREAADERLSMVTLAGPRSGRRARCAFAAALLGQPGGGGSFSPGTDEADEAAEAAEVALLAAVRCAGTEDEGGAAVVVLDVAADARGPASGGDALAAAVCALSSLVLVCADGRARAPDPPPSLEAWAPFRALAGDLARELPAAEALELLPRALALDLSPGEAALGSAASSPPAPPRTPPPTRNPKLDDLLALRAASTADAGVASARQALERGFQRLARPLAPAKTLFGAELTGDALLFLLRALAEASTDGAGGGAPLDLAGAWDAYVEARCRAAAEDALATYADCLLPAAREAPPMELEAFARLHADLSRLSMDVFHSAAAAFPSASAHCRAVRRQLKADVAARYEQGLAELRGNSRAFCEALKGELWGALAADKDREGEGEGEDEGAALLRAVREFDVRFSARARGPEKDAVLREFYRCEAVDAFERLRGVAAARASEAQVRELRARLEREAEARKQALAARFEAQEAQLRASVAREAEVARRAQAARLARAEMDARDAARAREAVAALERRARELEGQVAALEQAREDAQRQRARLERQAVELEAAARREMASRAELVDTLAATIRAAEDKERALAAQVAVLTQELGEKTFRVEGELQELARQLRKTAEEKDELRKRLGDVFQRVAALPPAVQQHVFCAAEGERVQFADALASFMSE